GTAAVAETNAAARRARGGRQPPAGGPGDRAGRPARAHAGDPERRRQDALLPARSRRLPARAGPVARRALDHLRRRAVREQGRGRPAVRVRTYSPRGPGRETERVMTGTR